MIRKSIIKVKKKLCKGCGNEDYLWSKGFCKSCALKKGKKLVSNTPIKAKPKAKNTELDSYFNYHIEILSTFGRSEESGKPIFTPTKVNICHLLDKSRHKSVSTHKDNCIYLTWEEHTRLDELLFKHEFDKVALEFPNSWGLIKERLKLIIPMCTEQTKFLAALKEVVNVN